MFICVLSRCVARGNSWLTMSLWEWAGLPGPKVVRRRRSLSPQPLLLLLLRRTKRTDAQTGVALPSLFLLLFLIPSPTHFLPLLLSLSPPRRLPPSPPSSPATMLWSRCWWRAWESRLWKVTLLSQGTTTWWGSPLPVPSPALRGPEMYRNLLQASFYSSDQITHCLIWTKVRTCADTLK